MVVRVSDARQPSVDWLSHPGLRVELVSDPSDDRTSAAGLPALTQGRIRIDHPDMPYLIELELRMTSSGIECDELAAIRREDGRPIGSGGLHELRVPELVRIGATRLVSAGVDVLDDAPTLRAYLEQRLFDGRLVGKKAPTVGPRIDAALFDRFVERYLECKATGEQWTVVLPVELNISKSTAIRWSKRIERDQGDA